jgi:hypothetical protein
MGFFDSLFESYCDKVAKVSDPDELIRLWKNKEKEKKPADQALLEARLAEVVSEVSDLQEFERLFVLIDRRTGDWIPQIKQALLSDDDQHLLALEDQGVYFKHLVALCETQNTFRAVLAENLLKQMGSVRPDLTTDPMKAALFESSGKGVPLMTVLETRLLEILADHVGRVDDINVMSGLFDLACLGASSSEFRVFKSREVALERLCDLIEAIQDPAEFKDVSVPQHPRIKESMDTMLKRLFS